MACDFPSPYLEADEEKKQADMFKGNALEESGDEKKKKRTLPMWKTIFKFRFCFGRSIGTMGCVFGRDFTEMFAFV